MVAAPDGSSANSLRSSAKLASDVTRFSYPMIRQDLTTSGSQVTWARVWSAKGVDSASQFARLKVRCAWSVVSR